MAFEMISNMLKFFEIVVKEIFSPAGAIFLILLALTIFIFGFIISIIKKKIR